MAVQAACCVLFCFFMLQTAYEMRISDWSSDLCSSDLTYPGETIVSVLGIRHQESSGRATTPISKTDTKLARANGTNGILWHPSIHLTTDQVFQYHHEHALTLHEAYEVYGATRLSCAFCVLASKHDIAVSAGVTRSEEHTSELQSLMRHSYAVFCFKKKNIT